jgi:RNA polymerase sigma-70 factor (ECF subfamily)
MRKRPAAVRSSGAPYYDAGMTGTPLADAFVHGGGSAGVREEALARATAHIERALPEVTIAREDLARYLGAHPRGRQWALSLEPAEAGVELALAWALRRGDRAAGRIFEKRYMDELGRTLARLALDPAELDDVKQRTREKLLVADASGHMRIEEYAGMGTLGGLVQVVATREALSSARQKQRERPADDERLEAHAGDAWDVGIEIGRAEYRAAFREAFAAAIYALEPRERNLLRMHLLGGVGLERIAAQYGVHRATAERWLAAAREKLLDVTRRGIQRRLALRADELDALMASAQSRLDVSVERFFATRDDA